MMMRKAAKKEILSTTMWAGRAATFCLGLAVMLALTAGVASTALAGTGVGAAFNLGVTNTVNQITKLVGSVAGPSLQIDNNSADANATALDLQVESGKAPMKVNSGTKVANLNADRVDGKSAGDFAPAYERTVVVSPAGTAQQNGAELKDALAGITDASQSNPYLIKIEPGVYDLGAAPGLTMKPFVDVEGSGEGVTTLTASGSSNFSTGTVVGAANSELRSLTVKNTGGATYAAAIYSAADPFRLTHVTATASGSSNNADSVRIRGGKATLSQLTATGSNRGMYIDSGSTVMLSQVDVTASGGGAGILNSSGNTQVQNSRISGNNPILNSSGGGGSVRVGASQLDGGPVGANNAACAGVYDENYDFYADTCP